MPLTPRTPTPFRVRDAPAGVATSYPKGGGLCVFVGGGGESHQRPQVGDVFRRRRRQTHANHSLSLSLVEGWELISEIAAIVSGGRTQNSRELRPT